MRDKKKKGEARRRKTLGKFVAATNFRALY